MRNVVRTIVGLAVLLLSASLGFTQDEHPQFHIKMLLDGRFIFTGKEQSWLDGSFGKGRYGGDGTDSSALFRLAQSSVLLSASLSDAFSARAQINIDAEPDRKLDRYRVDIIEAIASYKFILAASTRLRFRGGIFIPPVSLENIDPGWTSPYSITASSLNSWIGEEVRTTGIESSLTWTGVGNEIVFRGALFWQNDPAGTLLAWRGWALQDRQTGFNDRLPLPPIPAISPEGLFPRQPLFVEPFREVDGSPGFFSGVEWTRRGLELSALYYDNRADPTQFDGIQYGWNTDFVNAGAHLNLPRNFELIGQYMKGNSVMGFNNMVDIDFYAWFILGTVEIDRHRFTLRVDKFGVDDRDRYQLLDDNDEDGWGFLTAWTLKTRENHRLAVEYLHIRSDRPARSQSNLSDNTFQTSYRILFGR